MTSPAASIVLLLCVPAAGLRLSDSKSSYQSPTSLLQRSIRADLQAGEHLHKLGFGPAFEANIGGCTCDVHQLECWPEKECLVNVMETTQKRVADGHELRQSMKKNATVAGAVGLAIPNIGKYILQGTILNFKSWLTDNRIADWQKVAFAAPSRELKDRIVHQPEATEWFQKITSPENLEALEIEALKSHQTSPEASDARVNAIRKKFAEEPAEKSPDEILLTFAHMMRILVNPQQKYLTSYYSHASSSKVPSDKPKTGMMHVSLHVRRADSCGLAHEDAPDHRWETVASALDSPAQFSGNRNCYHTSVYVDKLIEVYDKYNIPLKVWVATDTTTDSTDGLVREIQQQLKERRNDIYESSEFIFSNWDKESKNYEDMIESGHGVEKDNRLTEIALGDLWHLSHGQFFIGHLGSGFGKAAYLLAVARQNTALPYVSVDGHNICCQIDEQCHNAVKGMHSMTDCLIENAELEPEKWDKSKYWTEGAFRKDTPGFTRAGLKANGKHIDDDGLW